MALRQLKVFTIEITEDNDDGEDHEDGDDHDQIPVEAWRHCSQGGAERSKVLQIVSKLTLNSAQLLFVDFCYYSQRVGLNSLFAVLSKDLHHS